MDGYFSGGHDVCGKGAKRIDYVTVWHVCTWREPAEIRRLIQVEEPVTPFAIPPEIINPEMIS